MVPGAAEIHARSQRSDLRNPRHRQPKSHGGKLQSRLRPDAGRSANQEINCDVGFHVGLSSTGFSLWISVTKRSAQDRSDPARRRVYRQVDRAPASGQSRALQTFGVCRTASVALLDYAGIFKSLLIVPPRIAIRSASLNPGWLSTSSTGVYAHGKG
jgi:hypothetical protein